MDTYEDRVEAGHAMLESALAKGINYWDTARGYGPSEGMIAPVLGRNRNRVFLASKSDSRDYDGFKRDLEESLRVLRTDYIDLYQYTIYGHTSQQIWARLNRERFEQPVKRKSKKRFARSASRDIPALAF